MPLLEKGLAQMWRGICWQKVRDRGFVCMSLLPPSGNRTSPFGDLFPLPLP